MLKCYFFLTSISLQNACGKNDTVIPVCNILMNGPAKVTLLCLMGSMNRIYYKDNWSSSSL